MGASFDLNELRKLLGGVDVCGEMHHFASVGSTNQLALDAGAAGARAGVWVADEQTAGRGRGGHHWHSVVGDGLYLTVLVTPLVPLSQAAQIPLLTGLAAQAAIRETTGLEVDIRWPNDLMFGDRKCGGILVESVSGADTALRYAAIGIGINVNHQAFPEELRGVATSLYLESERRFPLEPLVAAFLLNLNIELELLQMSFLDLPGGDSHLARRFTAASTWASGKRVTVEEAGGYTGWTRGLDSQGFLRVEDDSGTMRTVLSGGVRSA